jgi:hypothetical protein
LFFGEVVVNELDDIVDRAMDFTNSVLRAMPSYREAAVTGLRKLRDSLREKSPDHPALKRLDAYLKSLDGRDLLRGQ